MRERVNTELLPLVAYSGEGLAHVKGKKFTLSPGMASAVEELGVLAA